MSHYGYKSILHAKFQSGSGFNFGDMTSQIFPWKKETSQQIRLFTPENGFNFLKKNAFLCPETFFSTQNWPTMSISAISNGGNFFNFVTFWDVLMRKEQEQLP